MTWQAVARKDFHDAVRSKWLWGMTAVFVGLFVGSAYFIGSNLPNGRSVTSDAFVQTLGQFVITLLVPLVAIVASYSSIVGERESGTIKLLLSLPHSRQDAIAGKTAGRSAVVALSLSVGLVLALGVLVVYGVGMELLHYIAFTLLTVLLGVVFVSIAVGVSAATSTNRRAMLATVALYVVFIRFWEQVRRILLVFNDNLSLGWDPLAIAKYGLFIKYFNPIRAYQTLIASLYTETTLDARLYGANRMSGMFIKQQLGTAPFYLSDPVVLAQFLLWLVLPVAVGYLVFRDADL